MKMVFNIAAENVLQRLRRAIPRGIDRS